MKKTEITKLGTLIFMIIAPLTLNSCTHETKVEEKVNLNPDTTASTVATPDKDVNVNVHVNNPQPQQHDVVVEHDTKVINVQPPKDATDDKKIEVHTNIVNQMPSSAPNKTVTQKEVTVSNDGTTGTTVTDTTTNH